MPPPSLSGSTVPKMTGTETISSQVTGSAAAANLNNQDQNAPLVLGSAALSGPVTGTIKPFTLGGNSSKGTVTWQTTAGPLSVYHASTDPASTSNAPPLATWATASGKCHFTTTFDYGTFRQVAGSFVATTWSGTYKITAEGTAPLDKGKTACSFGSVGAVEADGASITFTASGPMTVKKAS